MSSPPLSPSDSPPILVRSPAPLFSFFFGCLPHRPLTCLRLRWSALLP
uniref:Uncharacterized protein n=1 Tax=Arundo donax TaxID=35708 RepID=A0A0A9FN37_ARUDO